MVVLEHPVKEITAVAMLLNTAHHILVAEVVAQAQSEQMAVVQTVGLVVLERHLQSQVVLLLVLVVAVAETIMEHIVVLAGQVAAATAKMEMATLGVVDQPTRAVAVEVAQTATMAVLVL